MAAKFTLDKNDEAINNIFDKTVVVLAFIQLLSPILTTFFCLIGIEIDIMNVMILVFVFYMVIKIVKFFFNLTFFEFKKPDIYQLICWSLLLLFTLSAIINKALNYTFVFYLSYVAIFCIFAEIDKKYYKYLAIVFVAEISVCSILGFFDPTNKHIPGFYKLGLPLSLQFANPNYAAYVLLFAIFACLLLLIKNKKLYMQIIFWFCYLILNFMLFLNGCYSAETALFLAMLVMVIFFWIKNKKCPYVILIALVVSIGMSFAQALYPNAVKYSTANANYFYETIAFIDNVLGTNLLSKISSGTGSVITEVAGSNGWGRPKLMKDAILESTKSFSAFMFGNGAGYNYDILVHNVYLQVWLENGIITLGLYITLLVFIAKEFIKNIKDNTDIFLLIVFFTFALMIHNFGCLESYSFVYFLMLIGIMFKKTKDNKSIK